VASRAPRWLSRSTGKSALARSAMALDVREDDETSWRRMVGVLEERVGFRRHLSGGPRGGWRAGQLSYIRNPRITTSSDKRAGTNR
jgi:hypothetical protein